MSEELGLSKDFISFKIVLIFCIGASLVVALLDKEF
jgi:preprotein translocase subunit SecE